ncbi:MAG: PQQ-binding-like beta-propeller repeat protein [Kofleriaceae bacterium]
MILVDGGRAVISTTRDEGDVRIALAAADGSASWQTRLPAQAKLARLVAGGKMIAATYELRQSRGPSQYETSALSAETGRVVWKRRLGSGRSYEDVADQAIWHRDRLLAYHQPAGTSLQFFALRASDGTPLWSTEVPFLRSFAPAVVGELAVFEDVDLRGVTIVDLRSGSRRELDVAGVGCVVDGEYVTLQVDGHGGLNISAFRDSIEPRTISVLKPFQDRTVVSLVSCGSYNGMLVFVVNATDRTDVMGSTQIVITSAAGQVLRTIALGADTHWASHSDHPRERASVPLHGPMTRFVPHVLVTGGDNRGPRLVMLDLEAGKIAWETPHDELIHFRVFRIGQFWLLSRRETLVVFDGANGNLVAAARFVPPASVEKVEPHHFADGQLWMRRRDGEGTSSLVVVDVPSLKPVRPQSGVIADVTDEFRALFRLK